MFIPNEKYETIKEAQIDILSVILDQKREVEETLEIDNVSTCITDPLKDTYDIFQNVTPIAEKHMKQMMLEPNPDLKKTHYDRLHNSSIVKEDKYGIFFIEVYDQIEEVIKKLKENPFSKRAVLTLWSPEDISDKYALSWTFSQLFIRNNKLIMTNYFRSCDIWNGFPYNCVGISNLQSEIAKRLDIIPGEFIVHIGSAHVYKNNLQKIEEYLA